MRFILIVQGACRWFIVTLMSSIILLGWWWMWIPIFCFCASIASLEFARVKEVAYQDSL